MTPAEVLSEIQKLPLSDARQVANRLNGYLRQQEQVALSDDELERREDEFEQHLLAKGINSSISTRDETDEADNFKPIKFEGEPLSEMMIDEVEIEKEIVVRMKPLARRAVNVRAKRQGQAKPRFVAESLPDE